MTMSATRSSIYSPLFWSGIRLSGKSAGLMLGEFNGSLDEQREAAQRWWKWYLQRERRINRNIDIDLSDKRMAASSAVHELDLMDLIDRHPQLFVRPGFSSHVRFVNFLNRNWAVLAGKKSGPALMKDVASKFRKHPAVAFSDSDLAEICDVYGSIESSHPAGAVPPYQVVLTLVARKYKVSPRLVGKVRAETNKRRNSPKKAKKARP
jgi:hypothetical protein